MRILKWLDAWFEKVIVVVLCTTLVAALTYSAVVRYFVTHPFFTMLSHTAEELAIFAFVFLLYFGAVLATRDGAHFRVSAHLDWIRPPLRRWRFLIGDLVWLAFNLFIVWQGMLLVRSALERPEPSLALGVPMQWIYLVIPLTFALTCLRLVQSYVNPPPEDEDPARRQL
ncbi:MAG: TRAP transporter small permease [Hyphomicrobiaceae bacterium]|nr:TRAP transporter small permease [Hyphomicrobiaceae bacterium]